MPFSYPHHFGRYIMPNRMIGRVYYIQHDLNNGVSG